MMGFNEISNQDHQLNFLDPFKGANTCKLRPLAPRLNLSPPNHNTCLTAFHAPTTTHPLLSLNNTNHRHFGGVVGLSEENNSNKEVVGTNQVMVSSRWNPTPEQLRALEELYRRGTRTPSADQIQHITAQLRRYGKIEGKNVFYWFQNHKARERQKRRRQLQLPPPPGSSTTGGNRVDFEGEQKSCKWASSSINKESDPPINQIIAEAEAAGAEAKASDQTSNTTTTTSDNGWIHFHHDPPQFQHNHNANNNINNNNNNNTISSPRNLMFAGERNATWHPTMVQPPPTMSSSSSCYPSPLIPFSLSSTKILSSPLHLLPDKQVSNGDGEGEGDGERPPSSPTLQLFPVVVTENDINSVEMRKEEEREKDASLILLQANCCNVEKPSSNGMGNSNSNNNNNNPFPYYQFL